MRERVKLVKTLAGGMPPRVAQSLASLMQEASHVDVNQGADLARLNATVTDQHLKYDIADGVCRCLRSQISGMPCTHMCALARAAGRDPSTMVHASLTGKALADTYAQAGPALDVDTSHLEVGPLVAPKVKRRVGRPRKRPLAHASSSSRAEKAQRRGSDAGAGAGAGPATRASAVASVVANAAAGRPWQPSAVAAAAAADAGRAVQPGARRKVPQRCSACGRTGHKRGTCGRDAQPQVGGALGVLVSGRPTSAASGGDTAVA